MTGVLANLLALLVMPIVVTGVITRVKARWAGRRGPPIAQLAFDLWRLLGKTAVYSRVTTPVFRLAPVVVLVTAVASACVVPLAGGPALVSFPFDFVWFAYAWGLGRAASVLGALDTGSSFEGMGAAREATFATLLEPVLFLVAGALCASAGVHRFADALSPGVGGGAALALRVAAVVALVVVVQVEAARMPVDDPTTHLELTMVHEVMILDHSGPELAALQLGAALKLFVGLSVIATLLDPLAGTGTAVALGVHVALCVVLAIALGLSEAWLARLRLRAVPYYIAVGLLAGALALLASLGDGGGG